MSLYLPRERMGAFDADPLLVHSPHDDGDNVLCLCTNRPLMNDAIDVCALNLGNDAHDFLSAGGGARVRERGW